MKSPDRQARRRASRWHFTVAWSVAFTPWFTLQDDGPPTDDALVETTTVLDPEAWDIGQPVRDVRFTDLDGREGTLSDYATSNALVVVVRDTGCPVSRRYAERIASTERQFADRGAAFLFVNFSPHDSVEECRGDVVEHGFRGRYVRQLYGALGQALRAQTTTEVFVLDASRRLRYRGAIDDQIGRGVIREKATQHLLVDALESVLEQRPVSVPATAAPGCLLDVGEDEGVGSESTPTWHGAVAPIVAKRCRLCHRPRGGAPFDLLEAVDLAGRRTMVRQVVTDKTMPPWFATHDSLPFSNDLRLEAAELETLVEWLDGGCPTGEPSDVPLPELPTTKWARGKPDLVVPLPKKVAVPASGVVPYRTVVTEPASDVDRWIQASQIAPGVSEVVHHVLVYKEEPSTGEWELLDCYVPGQQVTVHEPRCAMLLPAGSRLKFGVHYTPIGRRVMDRTRIGLYFAEAPPDFPVRARILAVGNRFVIPAGAEHFERTKQYEIVRDITLRKVLPHMHLRGRASRLEVDFPDGETRTIVDVERFHPDWQLYYKLQDPLTLPKGSVIRVTSVWDNSERNPFNPDPTKDVYRGPQIWQEMGGVFLEWSEHEASGPDEPRMPFVGLDGAPLEPQDDSSDQG